MHPVNNTNAFKSFIFKSTMLNIFFGFVVLYILIAIVFSGIYFTIIDENLVSYKKIIEFSLLSSFGFQSEMDKVTSDIFFAVNLLHQIFALLISTIFTAAIVLKFFYLPTFFVYKKKCNYENGSNELTISLYNSIDLFVTDCKIRIYGRVECLDVNGAKSLQNINKNKPIFEKTYPFMEMHLVTRLKLKFTEDDELYKIIVQKKIENKKFDLIILIEANASNLDSSIYEVYKYSLDTNNINKSIDFHSNNSIELDYENYSKSKGWDMFEK